jgi:hypothetical protein
MNKENGRVKESIVYVFVCVQIGKQVGGGPMKVDVRGGGEG